MDIFIIQHGNIIRNKTIKLYLFQDITQENLSLPLQANSKFILAHEQDIVGNHGAQHTIDIITAVYGAETYKNFARYTTFTSLLSTTNQGGIYSVGDDNKGQVDPNGVQFTDKEMMSTNTTNCSPLYYVISALLISICYISVSLFCWVHYNHKYASQVIELKRNHHSHSRLQSPAIMQSGVVWQANHLREPGAAVPIAIPNNYLNAPMRNKLRYNNSNNNTVPSVASNVTAPTTISHNGITYNNIIEEEQQQTISPTAVKSATHSINSLHSHYTENNSEFNEVDYETGGNNNNNIIYNITNMQQTSKYSMDSIEYNNAYIHGDESIVQYGDKRNTFITS